MAKISLDRWWAESKPELFASLKSSAEGLKTEEANGRLKTLGLNTLVEAKQTIVATLISIFANPLFLVLIIASVVSQLVGQTTDAIIIVLMITLSATIDFYQQYHAQRVVEKLRHRISLKTTVRRDGHLMEIAVSELTLGDVFMLESGEIVPADARVIESHDLQVDQSTLTGEAFPQRKNDTVIDETKDLNERTNCVYMGTSIISGEGAAIVTATAADSEFGRIAKELVGRKPKTEFEVGIGKFSLMLTKIITALVVFAFLAISILHHQIFESFLFALALAVGLTPELLPMIVTINLASGARRLAKKKVIVKDLRSIENFGSMGVLCTDKTGTLTTGKISVEGHFDVRGQPNEEVF
ncbi:MAG TPA: HAD-IC family P-type ATPase, partial [Candidatus Saccharimonadales bacterium]|nr:HAD-IC family P-type ATPase [Candidatus Saccharimonadales bacterium]